MTHNEGRNFIFYFIESYVVGFSFYNKHVLPKIMKLKLRNLRVVGEREGREVGKLEKQRMRKSAVACK